jgi:hypothetical protein
MFRSVSTNGTSIVLVQAGAGSVTNSGYSSTGYTNTTKGNTTAGFSTGGDGSAGYSRNGIMTLVTAGSNIWLASGTWGDQADNNISYFGGGITLGGTLDRVRITTVNGTDTFDAGTVNILYEG